MKTKQIWIIAALAAITLASCGSNNKDKSATDSNTDSSAMADSSSVKPADSTHSYRNDRGTDSVSAGKSVPAKP